MIRLGHRDLDLHWHEGGATPTEILKNKLLALSAKLIEIECYYLAHRFHAQAEAIEVEPREGYGVATSS